MTANTVSGEISGRTLTLRETEKAWTFYNHAPADSPLLKSGRTYVLTLGGPNSNEYTGTWSFNGSSGTLKLTAARLW